MSRGGMSGLATLCPWLICQRRGCVPVIRADFRDDGVWEQLKDEIVSPTEEDFVAGVEFVEDRALIGLSETAIAAGYRRAYPRQYRHPVVFVVDTVTVSLPERPLLVVNLNDRDETVRSGHCHGRSRRSKTTCRSRTCTSLSSRGRPARTPSSEASKRSASRHIATPGCTDLPLVAQLQRPTLPR